MWGMERDERKLGYLIERQKRWKFWIKVVGK